MKLTLRRRHSQSGNMLIVTVLVMAVVGVFVDLAMQYINSINRNPPNRAWYFDTVYPVIHRGRSPCLA